ncbi:Regulator of chromosome condensation 1/beta-lactamase-inhibitor protein II [Pseudocohnilembus persalinus]|uniref:non-specific serine/threonine protein kinase n=1 Tax=Pseudocohnilembus persalinus TaxID=266149 RepID=A0A0V0R5I9_PSEPJ|nr:Regulator of chromosome condensation 1/beta-lactamase-inhibitor protein II [Pseudocohnilembus persalinus]|eukprot:KRX09626.1 Regulator of chromosome condensation 1/beta-lactamase-inhibitor protein II [Pseudocohnilembus persalinus]
MIAQHSNLNLSKSMSLAQQMNLQNLQTENYFCTGWGYGGFDEEKKIHHYGNGYNQCAIGENFAMFVNSNLELYAIGNNNYGQLGIENIAKVTQPTQITALKEHKISQIVCGTNHTFALTTKGEVYSWGLNLKGQLGLGHFDNVSSPQLVHSLLPFGTSENTINFQLQADEVVTQIACGALHTLIYTNKNRIFACGYGETYALGLENYETINEFQLVQIPQVQEQQSQKKIKIDKIACGLTHSACIIGGQVYMWGIAGTSQQLIFQQPTQIDFDNQYQSNPNIIDLKLGDCLSVFLNYKGEVYLMGDNIDGQQCDENLQIINEIPMKMTQLPLVEQIQVGKNHVIAVSTDYQYLYCWGSNKQGQLLGTISTQQSQYFTTPKKLFIGNAEPAQIYCGSYYTIMASNNPLQGQNNFITQAEQEESKIENIDDISAQELLKLKNEISKLNQENEALKSLSTKILQKNEKLQGELQAVKGKYQLELKKQDSEGSRSKSAHKKNSLSKFELQGIELQTDKIFQHRSFKNQLEIDFQTIQLGSLISEGGYGKIYKAKWMESIVAVKMFKIDTSNENTLKDFLSECHAMEALRHPNIVLFMGACTKKPNFSIVMEYCKNGSLWSILQNHNINLSWERRRAIALDAAKGVFYLHKCDPPILHRDLKSLNLLLDDAMRCKLGDFGWTKSLSNYMTGKIGTYQWMAPEVIAGQTYTEKADVFSFGIILWEIASRQPPYRDKTGIQVSYEVLNSDLRPPIPSDTPSDFGDLIKLCWDKNPSLRPNFYQIVRQLETMRLPSSKQGNN